VRPSSPSGKGLGEECKHRQKIQKQTGGNKERREKRNKIIRKMDNDKADKREQKRKQKYINKEGEKHCEYKKIKWVSNNFENTATGRAASIKGHLNAARIVTLPGEEGGEGGR
jgi:hypothetical protein